MKKVFLVGIALVFASTTCFAVTPHHTSKSKSPKAKTTHEVAPKSDADSTSQPSSTTNTPSVPGAKLAEEEAKSPSTKPTVKPASHKPSTAASKKTAAHTSKTSKNKTHPRPASHKTQLKSASKSVSKQTVSKIKPSHTANSKSVVAQSRTVKSAAISSTQLKPAVLDGEEDAALTSPASTLSLPTTSAEAPKPNSWFSWLTGNRNANDEDSNQEDSNQTEVAPQADVAVDSASHTVSSQPLTSAAHHTVATLRQTKYRFGGNRFDPKNGIYMLDCSGYIDNILHRNSPRAYSVIAQWSGGRPNSEHYYNFFNHLTVADNGSRWNKVEAPAQLKAGDILVFRYKNSRGKSRGGHVMLVMDKPVGNANVLRVRVADSAETGHSRDTRSGRASGIGIGTLLLKVNPTTKRPYAYAWREDSPWNSRVSIAMGRPPAA